jgi:hypothetical protein
MTSPASAQVTSGDRVLMIATVPLGFSDQSGALPGVQAGAAFWYRADRAGGLVTGGQASYAPSGTTLPPWEPAHCVHGVPGFAAGTTNSSPGR